MTECHAHTQDEYTNAEHARAVAVDMVRTLQDAGYVAYFAGGCVRDELLGECPKDYDIATDAVPEQVAQVFCHTRFVGASFGVVQVRRQGVTVELATFRTDGSYSDRRRPDDVQFSTPGDDAKRRDFTINAMFLDPLAEADPSQAEGLHAVRGRIIDYVDGLSCLRLGLIKAVGNPEDRLCEDHLRALRAVRFAARYGFTIEQDTANAIRSHARDLVGVSRERVGDELMRMLAHAGRALAARIIVDLDLVEPVLGIAQRKDRDKKHADDLLTHLAPNASGVCALAAWMIELGCVDIDATEPEKNVNTLRELRTSLCLSNDATHGLTELWECVRRMLTAWQCMNTAHRKRLASIGLKNATRDQPGFAGAMQIVEAIDKARRTDVAAKIATDVSVLIADGIGLAPGPIVTGDHLIEQGYEPGPRFKQVLDQIYDAQLEARISTLQAGLDAASSLFAG